MYAFRGKPQVHTHMYVQQLIKEEAMNLKETAERYMGVLERRKGRGLCDAIILLSQKEKPQILPNVSDTERNVCIFK